MSVKNTDELRDLLSDVLQKVIDGTMAANQANAVSNLVGKFVQTVHLDIKYHQMKDSMPAMKFLDNKNSQKSLKHDTETGEIK